MLRFCKSSSLFTLPVAKQMRKLACHNNAVQIPPSACCNLQLYAGVPDFEYGKASKYRLNCGHAVKQLQGMLCKEKAKHMWCNTVEGSLRGCSELIYIGEALSMLAPP